MLNERNQTQNATYFMIPFITNVQNRCIHKERRQLGAARHGAWRLGVGGDRVWIWLLLSSIRNGYTCLMDMGFTLEC